MSFLGTLSSTTSLLSPIASIIQGVGGAVQQFQGSRMQAAGFRNEGAAAVAAANFNNAITELNLTRDLDSLRRSLRRTSSTQTAQAAGQGIDVNSPSVLAIMNETITIFEKEILDRKITAENNKRVESFEASVRQQSAEAQASQASFGGIINLVSSLPSLVSQVSGAFQGPNTLLSIK